jgi:hypothetical protein
MLEFSASHFMLSDLPPPQFPAELAAAAFLAGDEVAWPPALAVAAVEWFGSHNYAVLGTEPWLLQDDGIQSLPTGRGGMREVHGNSVNRHIHEAWSSFAARSAAETREYLQSFNPSDIVEKGQLYFNVVWVSEVDFDKLVPT